MTPGRDTAKLTVRIAQLLCRNRTLRFWRIRCAKAGGAPQAIPAGHDDLTDLFVLIFFGLLLMTDPENLAGRQTSNRKLPTASATDFPAPRARALTTVDARAL
jgi:hypothetical protein